MFRMEHLDGKGRKVKCCKDCEAEGITSNRIAPYAGPRCYSHHKARLREVRSRNHSRAIETTYGITLSEYQEIKEFQNGKCAICQKATGASRNLSVDHSHSTNLIRGLLCRPCNTLLGRAGDDPMYFARAIEYLTNPPTTKMGLKIVVAEDDK